MTPFTFREGYSLEDFMKAEQKVIKSQIISAQLAISHEDLSPLELDVYKWRLEHLHFELYHIG